MPIAPSAMTPGIDQISHGSRLPDCVVASSSLVDEVALGEPVLGEADDDGEADGDGEAEGDADGEADGVADGAGAGGWIRWTTAAGSEIWRTIEPAPSLLSRMRSPGPTEMPSPWRWAGSRKLPTRWN